VAALGRRCRELNAGLGIASAASAELLAYGIATCHSGRPADRADQQAIDDADHDQSASRRQELEPFNPRRAKRDPSYQLLPPSTSHCLFLLVTHRLAVPSVNECQRFCSFPLPLLATALAGCGHLPSQGIVRVESPGDGARVAHRSGRSGSPARSRDATPVRPLCALGWLTRRVCQHGIVLFRGELVPGPGRRANTAPALVMSAGRRSCPG
jgi:hypothetical protein